MSSTLRVTSELGVYVWVYAYVCVCVRARARVRANVYTRMLFRFFCM